MAEASDFMSSLPQQIPLDEDGFVVSYEPLDTDGIADFYQRYGFVVVRNVISEEQAGKTIDEIWLELKQESKTMFGEPTFISSWIQWARSLIWRTPISLDRDMPDTWSDAIEGGFWPYPGGAGIVGQGIAHGLRAWENRQSPELMKAFSAVLGTEELIVSCDRMGVMRPTRVKVASGEVEERPQWRTKEQWWHWDMNPWYWTGVAEVPNKEPALVKQAEDVRLERWARPNSAQIMLITENNNVVDFKGFDKVQGLIALADSGPDDGGFTCVPGFHKILKQWTAANEIYNTAHFVNVQGKEIGAHGKKIPMRMGSAVLWNSCLPHCNFPNNSENFRFCQYVKMCPAAVMPERADLQQARAEAVRSFQPDEFSPNPLGKKLFGFGDITVRQEE